MSGWVNALTCAQHLELSMRRTQQFVFVVFVIGVFLSGSCSWAIESQRASAFVGQDLRLEGRELMSYQLSTGEYILVFGGRFSMSIGAHRFMSKSAVVWLESMAIDFRGRARVDYKATVYLDGRVSARKGKGAMASELRYTVVEKGKSAVIQFVVSGEVFVVAEEREVADPRRLELYAKAIEAVKLVESKFAFEAVAVVAKPPEEERIEEPPEEKEPRFRYPVNIAPAGETAPKMERTTALDRTDIVTVIGRFYLWQQKEDGGLLELQADDAVIFASEEALKASDETGRGGGAEDILASGAVRGIYLSGDVVMTEGRRTIRADEMYYDFERQKALAINAEMRSYDVSRGIPVYVRAQEFRQEAENKFTGENATLTSSEFYVPQLSVSASRMTVIDTTPVDERGNKVTDSSYDAEMHDVRVKLENRTIFYWPHLRSNLQRPDTPLKSMHAGYERRWGMLAETQWYLARLLGLREPEGTDSTLLLDYYSKRGLGGGVGIDYTREDYFGSLLGYIIHDKGEDRLGRHRSRRGLEPPRQLRGRFRWQHRQYLPHNWQLTAETSYLSDRNFLESYYRGAYYTAKEDETIVHLKRIEDNWGLALLGKWRINDFMNKVEELPSAEFHWTGQSLLDDKLTFYSDSQISRFRQRLGTGSTSTALTDFYTYMSERAELDMPLKINRVKFVPFVAGTVGYDDGSGFRTDIDGSPGGREDKVWLGEVGARASLQPFWKVYPDVKSRLWDLNGMRHIIEPRMVAVGYFESDSVIEQRDTLSVGLSQRLQTKRGPADKQRTVDWMRLDMDVTWVGESDDPSAGADRFIWNNPFMPLSNRFSTAMPPRDRRSSNIFGPRRNYVGMDYMWRLSDTTALLSDMNFDIQSKVVQQFNIGFSRMVWPNLSYYIGSRYLKRIDNNYGEHGSNAVTFAATYKLDPRYTLVFSQQYDFDYGASIRSDITLIRRYHRLFYAITFRTDESLDEQAVIFSVWPEGVPEMAIGPTRYMGLAR